MGLNEFAGYGAVALSALATGYIASIYGLRPQPFYVGVGFAAAGLFLSAGLSARLTITPVTKRRAIAEEDTRLSSYRVKSSCAPLSSTATCQP
jgi:uncharacterized membrane protein